MNKATHTLTGKQRMESLSNTHTHTNPLTTNKPNTPLKEFDSKYLLVHRLCHVGYTLFYLGYTLFNYIISDQQNVYVVKPGVNY